MSLVELMSSLHELDLREEMLLARHLTYSALNLHARAYAETKLVKVCNVDAATCYDESRFMQYMAMFTS